MAGFGKEAWQDDHTECTNRYRHEHQYEEQSNAFQVGDGHEKICQHKLGRDCAGCDDILVDIVIVIGIIIIIVLIFIIITSPREARV